MRLTPFVCILGAAACQSAPPVPMDEPAAFTFVRERYDANGDGAVSEDEYRRAGVQFARLDRTGDGVLRADDFETAGRRMLGMRPEEARRQRARHLLAWYFQGEGTGPHRVEEEELLEALAVYDVNGDGRVGRTEFEARAATGETYGRTPSGRWAGLLELETTDPWERLLQGADLDGNGFLTAADLEGFYGLVEERDGWSFDPRHGVAIGRSLDGLPAPDFSLPSLDGSGDVTLSDFAGDRPVALIFGSYT